MAEFLPLCDLLFNIISLTIYFCDIVFDLVFAWALLERSKKFYFTVSVLLITFSLIACQTISLRWYFHHRNLIPQEKPPDKEDPAKKRLKRFTIVGLHLIPFAGIFWRYAKLLVPVDLGFVKYEVRDLCIIRLIHAFCEAAPMLLLQLHVLFSFEDEQKMVDAQFSTLLVQKQRQEKTFKDLNTVSALLSLFNVCWALASFSKNVRLVNVHRLVLTWLGVIFQFFWRLGTVTARVAALTIYASIYGSWVLLVIFLHWISMFLWITFSPKNVFNEEAKGRKFGLSAIVAVIFIFAYVNLQESGHRQKLTTFYVVMFLENTLLVLFYMVAVRSSDWSSAPFIVFGSFALGIFFMLLYYRFFHVRRLKYEAGGRIPTLEKQQKATGEDRLNYDPVRGTKSIPGVFNCRISNPVIKRKRKKPTTFIPHAVPPSITEDVVPFWRRALPPRSQAGGSSENDCSSVGSRINIQQKLQEKKQKQLAELKIIEEEIKQGKLTAPKEQKAALPCQPIPRMKRHEWAANHSANYNSFGLNGISITSLNKFIEETQQEVAAIEQNGGSLTRQQQTRAPPRNPFAESYRGGANFVNMYAEAATGPSAPSPSRFQNRAMAAPSRSKSNSANNSATNTAVKMTQQRLMQRAKTPEILLSPSYLENSRVYYDDWMSKLQSNYRAYVAAEASSGGENVETGNDQGRGEGDATSDIDSQISLPRSYTLPREFRYYRRQRGRKPMHFASTNSSDGDVDSCESETDHSTIETKKPTNGYLSSHHRKQITNLDLINGVDARLMHNTRRFRAAGVRHETKL